MDVGVHLPLADLGQRLPSGAELRDYTATAAGLGFTMVSANDHLVWRRPWRGRKATRRPATSARKIESDGAPYGVSTLISRTSGSNA